MMLLQKCCKFCRSSRPVWSEGKSKMGCLGISKRWGTGDTFILV